MNFICVTTLEWTLYTGWLTSLAEFRVPTILTNVTGRGLNRMTCQLLESNHLRIQNHTQSNLNDVGAQWLVWNYSSHMCMYWTKPSQSYSISVPRPGVNWDTLLLIVEIGKQLSPVSPSNRLYFERPTLTHIIFCRTHWAKIEDLNRLVQFGGGLHRTADRLWPTMIIITGTDWCSDVFRHACTHRHGSLLLSATIVHLQLSTDTSTV